MCLCLWVHSSTLPRLLGCGVHGPLIFCHTTDGVLLEPHPNGGGGKWSGGLACYMPERDDEMSGAALRERATRCEPMAQGG